MSAVLRPAEVLAEAILAALPARLRGLVVLPPERVEQALPGQAVRLALPESSLLVEPVDPPKAGATAAWLAARAEAISPWEAGAYLWQARDLGARVEIGLVPLAAVAQAEARLAGCGARLAEVTAGPFRFRSDAVQTRRWRDRILLAVGLATVLCLGLAGFGLTLAAEAGARQATAEAALSRTTARLQEGAGPAQAALALVSTGGVSRAEVLAHLAAALPDNAYLTTLSLTADGFELSGQTAAPDSVIPALSADTLFAGVDFAGPAARNAETGSYSFTVRGKVVTP